MGKYSEGKTESGRRRTKSTGSKETDCDSRVVAFTRLYSGGLSESELTAFVFLSTSVTIETLVHQDQDEPNSEKLLAIICLNIFSKTGAI